MSLPGELVRAKVTRGKKRRGGKPRAVITITQTEGHINVHCEFLPTANMKGPAEPAHVAAVAALAAIGELAKRKS